MNSHNRTPWSKGFMPTFRMDSIVRPAPIKNRVSVKPFFAISTMTWFKENRLGTKVLISIAITNRKMK